MFILLLVLGIMGIIASVIWYNRSRSEDGEIVAAIFVTVFTLSVLATAIAICFNAYTLFTSNVIDEKIAMYQEENAKIQEQINTAVKEYMSHESDMYKDLKAESSITLATLYPELKSNEIVQKQIEVYLCNNEIVKGLKNEKIEVQKLKWLLYFGK